MYRERAVAVVIPAYNEEAYIVGVLDGIPPFVDHVVVVDDASRDRTAAMVRESADPRVRLVEHAENQGVGAAMRTGYGLALELGADVVVKMDGDGQMDPRDVHRLLDALIDADAHYAKGNRFLEAGVAGMPAVRLVGNTLLTFLTKLASGYWHIFDPQNGFTAIRAEALRTLDLSRVARGYFFENDMLVHLNVQRRRVVDVAMTARYPHTKTSLSVPRVAVTFPLLLLSRFRYRIYQKYVLRDFSPIALFLGLGLLLSGWGVVFGAAVWWHSIVYRKVATTGTVMLSALPLILGFQLILQAIVLDIAETPGRGRDR